MTSLAPIIKHLPFLVANMVLLGVISSVAAFDCPCFSSSDLDPFNADNVDFNLSCRESHMNDSGINIVMKETNPDSDIAPPGYKLEFGAHGEHLCLIGWDNFVIIPQRNMAEDCADLIRSKCQNIGDLSEY
eukprot:27332_1